MHIDLKANVIREKKRIDWLKSVPLDSRQFTKIISRVNKVGLRVKPRTKPHFSLIQYVLKVRTSFNFPWYLLGQGAGELPAVVVQL